MKIAYTMYMSHSSVRHIVYKWCLLQRGHKVSVCGKEIISVVHIVWFIYDLQHTINFEPFLLLQMCLQVEEGLLKSMSSKSDPLPHTDAFWRLNSRPRLKTLWQKKKLLKMSNFATMFSTHFYNQLFLYRDISHVLQIICCRFAVCGNGLSVSLLYSRVT